MTTLTATDMGICDCTINHMPIQSIGWSRFKGAVPENPPYFAHIFWNIQYKYYFRHHNSFKPTLMVRPYILNKSWARSELVTDRLLKHQYGHYLIACLCGLKVQQKVNNQKDISFQSRDQAVKFIQQKFKSTMKEYLAIQKKYDEDTEHYYNEQEQQKWQKWIVKQINSMAENVFEENMQRKKSYESISLKSVESQEKRSSRSKSRREISINKYRHNNSAESHRRRNVVSISRNQGTKKAINLPPLPGRPPLAKVNS